MSPADTESAKKSGTREFWDANPCGTSTSWDRAQELRFEHTDPYLLKYLTPGMFSGKSVLEIGCGQGLDAQKIAEVCREYVGIDLSEASVEAARREVIRRAPPEVDVKFLVDDAESLGFKDAEFDFVYSCGVLHHTPDFDAALNEALRVLAPGGDLFLMLYRKYTPLWVVLSVCRGAFRLLSEDRRERFLARQRENANASQYTGTAILELFGCPVIDCYTIGDIRRKLDGRAEVMLNENHRVGTEQVIRVLPAGLRKLWPHRLTLVIERSLRRMLGFYMVIHARKVSGDSPSAS